MEQPGATPRGQTSSEVCLNTADRRGMHPVGLFGTPLDILSRGGVGLDLQPKTVD